jgi:glutamate-5-semialdehyde dehydrogenase
MSDLREDVKRAKVAAIELAALDTVVKNAALKAMAEALDKGRRMILAANDIDMAAAEKLKAAGKLTDALVKRLKVTDEKITGMIDGIEDIAKIDDPVGETMSTLALDDGLTLYQVKCPIGVLGVIFESRPDVVPQIMSLCLKSGNAVVFKGGSEASNSNKVLFDLLTVAASSVGIPRDSFVLMHTREDVNTILKMEGDMDLLIPRGSNEFVKFIQNNTKIPVLGHSSGICHIYVDEYADIDKALSVVLDSKIQYPAVCNAVETLLVNSRIATEFLPEMARLFTDNGVEIRADERAISVMDGAVRASESDWDTEYNDLIISVKLVDSVLEAIHFINKHGSHHTDAIITENKKAMTLFSKMVDSADVFINASTRFSDGYRFGKGAEVGISTNKIHSRGPVGMEVLMIYKYILVGEGQVVKDYVGKNARKFKHVPLNKNFDL